jgi:hypothetical protein
MKAAEQEEDTSHENTANKHTGEATTGKLNTEKPHSGETSSHKPNTGGKSKPAEKKHTGEQSTEKPSTNTGKPTAIHTGEELLVSQTIRMASNTLANLRACVQEFDTEESCDVQNLARKFKSWLENFEACADFEELSDNRRRPALLALGGEKLRELIKTLGATATDTYVQTKTALNTHFTPKKTTSAERFKFLNMRPESPEETHDHWVTRMRKKVRECEFEKMNDEEAMKLVIMLHTHNATLQRQIIAKDMDFKKTIEQACALELTDRELARIKDTGPQINANKVSTYTGGRARKQNNKPKANQCIYCGGEFPHSKQEPCKAKSVNCHSCGKQGHYGRMCKSKPERKRADAVALTDNTDEDIESIIEAFLIRVNQTSDGAAAVQEGYPSTTITGTVEGAKMTLHMDSMADANILGKNHFEPLAGKVKLETTSATIKPYGSPAIPTLGKFQGKLATSKGSISATFYVTQGKQPLALLGKYTAFDLGILKIEAAQVTKQKQNSSLSYRQIAPLMTPKETTKTELKEVYKKHQSALARVEAIVGRHEAIFHGVGKHKYRQVSLPVDPKVPLKIQPQRKVPFAKRDKLKKLLLELEESDVIEHVDGPTDCISNLVLTSKANPDEIRMNIDMTCANEAILRTRHVIPALDEMRALLNGATVFSKLDMRYGYMQLELEEASRHLTTFYTPEGLRRSKRLIFGANAAAELFHEEIRRSIADIERVMNIYDDMLVYGNTQIEHDFALARILQRMSDLGLTLVRPKCLFSKPQVVFFGMMFSAEGMSPTEDRVQALMEASIPRTVQEIRSFLGMANFSAPFILSYATMTAPLRELTKKNASYRWTHIEQNAFDQIKHALKSDTVMAYFDPERETQVIVDGSKKDGVASILTQKDPGTARFRVIRYDSRATTAPEKNYAPIEVESLSILFALTKKHLYLHGMKEFTVCTDHKPLVPLYSQYRKEMTARVERHKIALQGKYNFRVIWAAGKDNPADYNSRHPGQSSIDQAAVEAELAVSAVVVDAIPDALTIQQIALATEADPTLRLLKQAVQKGHLDTVQTPQLKEYAKVFEALSIIDGILCRSDRIVVPSSLQREAIEISHEAHQGITKTKQYLRSRMWFPRMDTLVEERLQSCLSCLAATESKQREPILPTEMPTKPWNTLWTDIFGPLPTGEYLVLVQDLHSRFPEVAVTHSTSATAVIPAIDKILAAYGTPEVMGSDNGPPYNSTEFMKYARKMGFQHRKITPLAPWANGTAERFMKNLAKVLQVAQADKKNWRHELTKFLRAYRATPHSMTGASPASLLFNGRAYRTNLPSIRTSMTTPEQQQAISTDQRNKVKMKDQADKGALVKHTHYAVGDRVLLKQKKKNKLDTAYESEPYTIEEVKGRQITAQNRIHQVCRHANLFKKIASSPALEEEDTEASSRPSAQDPEASASQGDHVLSPPLSPPPSGQLVNAPPVAGHSSPQTASPQRTTVVDDQDTPETEEVDPQPSIAPPPRVEPRRSQRANVQAPSRYRDQDWVE